MSTSRSASNTCNACSRRVVKHKLSIQCWLCQSNFHPKCANLTPNDVRNLTSASLHRHWLCTACRCDTFPSVALADNSIVSDQIYQTVSDSSINTVTPCYTCGKIGLATAMTTCNLCDKLSHNQCSSGTLGCKSCLREIFPGFDCKPEDLLPNAAANNAIFNPYSTTSALSGLGISHDDFGTDDIDWSENSDLLYNCNYTPLYKTTNSRSSELKVLSLNIRSLNNKIGEIRDRLEHLSKFDIVCFNETSCNPVNLPFGDSELHLENFHPPIIQSPTRESCRGGGLALYINKNFCDESDCNIMNNLSENSNVANGEYLFVEISRKNKNIVLGNMYRSPSEAPATFLETLEQKLNLLHPHRNKHIVLVSDSNLDLLKYGHHTETTRYVDVLSEHGFAPAISRPTRVTSHSATLIDHIFVNNCHSVTKSGVITEGISDHLPVFVTLLVVPNCENHRLNNLNFESGNFRQINETNLENFKIDLQSADWADVFQAESADEKFENFEKVYTILYNKNFPCLDTSRKKKRKSDKAWILPWLQTACDRKNALFKVFVKNPTLANEKTYKDMKKFTEKHIKLAKAKFYKQFFETYSNDSRKQWQMINQLLYRKRKAKTVISKIIVHNRTVTNASEIAHSFNDFFCNIAQKLKDESHLHFSDNSVNDPIVNTVHRVYHDIQLVDYTTKEVTTTISSLKNKATSDTAIKVLKHVSIEVAPLLQHLISSSLSQGIFPAKLKCAKVIPLHKGGSKSDLSNYRPISLLSCFSKLYERAMHSRVSNFLAANNILYSSQYGFRSGHSCEHALLEAQSFLLNTLDKKQIAALLLIDFSKAFDMVDHSKLLCKLEHYGIRGLVLNWFKSYLTNRSQYVHVNNTDSTKLSLRYGVPQGSILGPLLFVVYINDIPFISSLAKFILYADDANIIITADNFEDLQNKIERLLEQLQSWVHRNGLKLNIKKTKYMIFSKRAKVDIDVKLFGTPIERSSCERFLGVLVDDGLTWSSHIKALSSKLSRNSGIMFKLKGIVPESVLKILYNSFIQSHINYCSSVWGLRSKNSVEVLFRAQKKAVRAMEKRFNNCFYNKETGELPCHTKEIFERNKVLTVHNLIAKNCLTMMQRVYIGLYPQPIKNMFSISLQNSRSRNQNFFDVPLNRLKTVDQAISYIGPKFYNFIVNKINKEISECLFKQPLMHNKFHDTFKKYAKSFLLDIQAAGDKSWDKSNFPIYSI